MWISMEQWKNKKNFFIVSLHGISSINSISIVRILRYITSMYNTKPLDIFLNKFLDIILYYIYYIILNNIFICRQYLFLQTNFFDNFINVFNSMRLELWPRGVHLTELSHVFNTMEYTIYLRIIWQSPDIFLLILYLHIIFRIVT